MLLDDNEKMFIPANSMVTPAVPAAVHNTTNNVTVVDQTQSKPSNSNHSIDEDNVCDTTINSEQQRTSTDISDEDNFNSKTNSDIASALKEVLNMDVPGLDQLPTERKLTDIKVLGERTREHLNLLYHSTLLNSAKHKALKIGK